MRPAIYLGALFAGLAILAACAGGGGRGSPNQPSAATGVTASCQPIGEIQSYRYTISLQLESPAFQTSNGDSSDEPLSAFADALTALFGDMQLEGAYVAPDRSQTILRFQNEEVELRVIGGQSWIRVGATWQVQDASSEDNTLLTPQSVCEEIVEELFPSLPEVDSQPESVNGVETDYYRLDEAELETLPELVGATSALPENFVADLWLTREGGWPMRLRITASDTNEAGQPFGLELFMEFRDINDPNIEIEPPQISPLGT